MLLAISTASRCSELAFLNIDHMVHLPNGIRFNLAKHKKNKKGNCLPGTVFFPSIPSNPILCPVKCLDCYINRTSSHREKDQFLLRSFIKPFGKVTPTSISRWLTQIIILSGGPVLKKSHKGHSVRGVATSYGLDRGLSVNDIINAGDWKQDGVFFKYYYNPTSEGKLGKAILELNK